MRRRIMNWDRRIKSSKRPASTVGCHIPSAAGCPLPPQQCALLPPQALERHRTFCLT